MDVDDSSPDSDMRSYDLPVIPSDSSPDSDMRPYDERGSWLYRGLYEPDEKQSVPKFLIGNRNARLPEQIGNCEEVCKILLETYNTTIIDHFSDELKKACVQEAIECSNTKYEKGTKREVLAELINNKIDIKESDPVNFDFVGGPFNITYHWNNNYKKAVYIWGEIHGKKLDYPDPKLFPDLKNTTIENFLLYHFSKPIAFSDFYIEMGGHLAKKGYSYTGETNHPDYIRLNVLRKTFANCVANPQTIEFCKKSRMHFFDIRQGEVKGGINLSSLFQFAIQNFVFGVNSTLKTYKDNATNWDIGSSNYILIVLNIYMFIAKWESFFNFLALFDDDSENTKLNLKKFWYDQLRTFNIVNKEISLMHADVRPLLNIFIKKELDLELDLLLDFNYKEIAQYSKDILTTYRDLTTSTLDPKISQEEIIELITKIDAIFNFGLLKFNAIISDAYLLARIFKTFQTEDDTKSRLTDEPAEPHNVIIYAGNLHSQRYRTFLKYIGFRLVEQSGKLDSILPNPERTNCVDMRDITQPLFSYCPYYAEDNPIDESYFGNPSSYSSFVSFDSVFSTSFVGFTPFPQPVVPADLLSSVSVYSTINPTPNPRIEFVLNKTRYGNIRSDPRKPKPTPTIYNRALDPRIKKSLFL
jgi:hypothetical protein